MPAKIGILMDLPEIRILDNELAANHRGSLVGADRAVGNPGGGRNRLEEGRRDFVVLVATQ
jgi:hypothetical protein